MFVENKHVVMAGALVALAVAGGAVWIKQSNAVPQPQYYPQTATALPLANAQADPAPFSQNASYSQQGGVQQGGVQQNNDPCASNAGRNLPMGTYSEDGYYSNVRRPVYVHRAVYNAPAPQSTYVEPGYSRPSDRYSPDVRRGRSVKKSVAIVAGTAAVGAAIGGVAAGGKGAALGALSGGGAGFLYDRLTHKH